MAPAPSATAARAFVAALAAAGVRHVCVSPGSRSTPLTLAFARQPGVRAWLHLDERSAAFFGIGLARASGEPVALVCTSGTAAANYLPAVVEANLSRVPLIVCTADRPTHLRDVGAEQTVDQVAMYGRNVRWAYDAPVPSGAAPAERALEVAARRAVALALGPLPGPVHINLPFDEPLVDSPGTSAAPVAGGAAYTARTRGQVSPSGDLIGAAGALARARRPLIVAGPETGGLPAGPILDLAAELGAPVLADPLSGLRTGPHERSLVIDSYDAFLRDVRSVRVRPDTVVRFGGVPTSKPLNQFLAASEARQVLCDLPGGWRDPSLKSAILVSGDPASAAAQLRAMAGEVVTEPGWLRTWQGLGERARAALRDAAVAFTEPFEGRVFVELQSILEPGSAIFAGNSMPVRDLDAFLASDERTLDCQSNRGANGIDGVTSTALGLAAVRRQPTVLVVGDIGFYHDMNGLWAGRQHAIDLTIVLVNNNGGGIFHYLPQAGLPDVFEEWFGTPPNLDFRPAVEMYGGDYVRADDWGAFRNAIAGPRRRGLQVVEVRTDRARNAVLHREAWSAACAAAWGSEEPPK